jgi:hypothetical protein
MMSFLKEECGGFLTNHCKLVLIGASVGICAMGGMFGGDVT